MQTVVETATFIKAADRLGMSVAEIKTVVDPWEREKRWLSHFYFLQRHRYHRVLTDRHQQGETDNLTKSERNALAVLTKELATAFR
jgi:DNA-binding transcriptional MerR regulator